MKCLHTECTFNTDSEIPEVRGLYHKQKLLELHEIAAHCICRHCLSCKRHLTEQKSIVDLS